MEKKFLVDIQVILDVLNLFTPTSSAAQFLQGYNECKDHVTAIITAMKGEE